MWLATTAVCQTRVGRVDIAGEKNETCAQSVIRGVAGVAATRSVYIYAQTSKNKRDIHNKRYARLETRERWKWYSYGVLL